MQREASVALRRERVSERTSHNHPFQELLIRKADPQANPIMQIIISPPKHHLKAAAAAGRKHDEHSGDGQPSCCCYQRSKEFYLSETICCK